MEKKELMLYYVSFFYCDNLLLPLNKLSVVQSNSTTALSHFEDSMKLTLLVAYAGDYCEIP